MNIADLVRTRHATKAFDPAQKIPESAINELRTLLRFSPSSINSQPWHFVIAGSDGDKARIARATQGGFAYNKPKIRNASHVIVLCARTDMDESHLTALLAQEEQDGRFARPEARNNQIKTRNFYIDLHRNGRKDLQHWMEKQVYLALGMLLLGAAMLDIDAGPMEGFDAGILDDALGLREKGLTSVAIVALGHRSADDFNAKLPKSRLPAESIFTTL